MELITPSKPHAEEILATLRDARPVVASLLMLLEPGVGYLPRHPELLTRMDALLAKPGTAS